jgi:hypothetical protein
MSGDYANNIKMGRAWGDGQRAQQLGQLIGTNPHPNPSEQFTAWNDGFNGVIRSTLK